MDPSAAARPPLVLPRWPVYLRYGDNDEVKIGDVYAENSTELLCMMAKLLRSTADHLETRALEH